MSKPTAVILGASTNREKFGNKSVRAHADRGYDVFPVNPRAEQIEGYKCSSSIGEAPDSPDRVSVYLPPNITLELVDEIAAKQPKEVWLNPGAESSELVAALEAKGVNVIAACSIVDLGVSPASY